MTVMALGFLMLAFSAADNPAVAQGDNLRREELVLRDPFVMPVEKEGLYYLYGSSPVFGESPFVCYTSKDLATWSGPYGIVDLPEGFWATQDYWAPEVHEWKGRYYLFATYSAEKRTVRRTHIAVADSPRGPFVPVGKEAQTPRGWMCLDGTLFVDDAGAPWMVFCHEWIQVHDGEICAIRLSEDLAKPVGDPLLLFRASEAKWVTDKRDKVTDGPFLYRTSGGKLLMLWSSFGKDAKYKVAVARSASGKLEGPWEQSEKPLYEDDGGHAMLFKTFDGRLMMALHTPNSHPARPVFLPMQDTGDTLTLVVAPK